MKDSMTIGIIGCGTVTQISYAKVLPSIPNIHTAFVYDVNRASAEKAAKMFNATVLPVDEMRKRANAIIIATPPQTHMKLVSDCLAEGNIVVCEKPFVGRKADALQLIALAKERKSALFVAHFRRMFPSVQLVRSITASGVLGNVIGLHIIEGGRFTWDAQSGYISKDPYGGVLFDTGSHTIDMALFAAMLDDDNLNISLNAVQRDRAEPSHSLKATFSFDGTRGSGKGKVQFSRFQVLANKITIEYERGKIEFPVNLSQRVRIVGPSGATIVFAEHEMTDLMEAFASQYMHIFNSMHSEIFRAEHFVNLTSILESIANG